jgi:hypothetical protein
MAQTETFSLCQLTMISYSMESVYFIVACTFPHVYDFQNAFKIIHFSITYYGSEIRELNGPVNTH